MRLPMPLLSNVAYDLAVLTTEVESSNKKNTEGNGVS